MLYAYLINNLYDSYLLKNILKKKDNFVFYIVCINDLMLFP